VGLEIKGTMPVKRLSLVVGLGNPGVRYEKTRHNAGFMVADSIAEAYGISLLKRKFNTLFGRGSIEALDVVLAKPMAFMNRSGLPTKQLAEFFKIPSSDLLVIHDDIDLAFGKIRIKEKGGHGGHNGIRSLIAAFGGGDFIRLRIGVGRSEGETDVTDHVLGDFNLEEAEKLERIITTARDAAVTILCEGTKTGMNKYNNKNVTISH